MATKRQTQGSPWLCPLQVQRRNRSYDCWIRLQSCEHRSSHFHDETDNAPACTTYLHHHSMCAPLHHMFLTCRNVTFVCVHVTSQWRTDTCFYMHKLLLTSACRSIRQQHWNTQQHSWLNAFRRLLVRGNASTVPHLDTIPNFQKCGRLSQSMFQTFAKKRSPLLRKKTYIPVNYTL